MRHKPSLSPGGDQTHNIGMASHAMLLKYHALTNGLSMEPMRTIEIRHSTTSSKPTHAPGEVQTRKLKMTSKITSYKRSTLRNSTSEATKPTCSTELVRPNHVQYHVRKTGKNMRLRNSGTQNQLTRQSGQVLNRQTNSK